MEFQNSSAIYKNVIKWQFSVEESHYKVSDNDKFDLQLPSLARLTQAFGKGEDISSAWDRKKGLVGSSDVTWYYSVERVEHNIMGVPRNWLVRIYLTKDDQLSYCAMAFGNEELKAY